MLKNYFKIAFRNLGKRKGSTFLNVAGLVIGMTACMLIFHYVSYERSYDTFQTKGSNIVRLRLDSYQQGQLAWKSATVYPAFGPTMKKDFPEVENFCRLYDAEVLLSNDARNVKFREEKGYFADSSFLPMFNVQFVKGRLSSALSGPNKIVLSESMARKYFGNEEPLGKQLTIRNPDYTWLLEVTGVMKEFRANSHLVINHLISYSTFGSILRQVWKDTSNSTETAWGWYDFYTYLQLQPNTDLKKFEAKFPAFCDRYINNLEWAKTNNVRNAITVLPLRDIHLYSNYNQEAEVNGNGEAVGFLFLIALIIIVIAWINYINLSTARSVERAREVGIRKVLGAERRGLIRQFLTESLLLNFIAFVLSAILFVILVRGFDNFTGRTGTPFYTMSGTYWLGLVLLFFGGTLLSGIYPAFVLSSYRPVSVLKGAFKNSAGGVYLRKALIITQFVTSVVLIAGTMIVYKQVNYMRDQKLGADINQTLIMEGAQSVRDSLYSAAFQPFKQELLQIPGIKYVAASSSVMGKEIYWTSGFKRLDIPEAQTRTLYIMGVDFDFLPAYKMELLAGRYFSKDIPSDDTAAILTESGMKMMGFRNAEEAINKAVTRGRRRLTVIGVVRSYHHQGLQKAIDPMILVVTQNIRTFYSAKLEGRNASQVISAIKTAWNKHFPADPFNYFFLNEYFDQQYKSDILFGKVFAIFAILGIIIASFGLLGLSSYNVLQRTREIGIRKVLGASEKGILVLLSRDFMKLVFISLVIAIPVGWYIMYEWLKDFAYRTNITWWIFASAGIIALSIAMITICVQALKAVMANPVKSLRTE